MSLTLSQGTPAPSSSCTGLAEPKLTRASTQGSQGRCWPWISYHTRPPWAAPSAPRGSHHTMGRKQTVTRGQAVAALWHTAGRDAAPASCSDPTHPSGSTQHPNPSFLTAETQRSCKIPHRGHVWHGEVTGTSMDPLLGHRGKSEPGSPGESTWQLQGQMGQISWQCTARAQEMPGLSQPPSKQQNSSESETNRPRARW